MSSEQVKIHINPVTHARTLGAVASDFRDTSAAANALLNEISSKCGAGFDYAADWAAYLKICKKAKALSEECFHIQRDIFIAETRNYI